MLSIAAAIALARGTASADVPPLESPSIAVLDGDGGLRFARHADEVRPIASMTKIFAAMVVRAHKLDLEAWTEITDEDAAAARGGAPTALVRGESFRNIDLLHAMLLVSDNRVPTALARSVGLSPSELLAAMNDLARSLGLEHTKFDDVTGITGNHSTAREMAVAMRKAVADPVLRRIMHTRYARIRSRSEAHVIDYKSTVKPLWSKAHQVRAGKTGTTEGAGHCMMIAADIGSATYTMVFLGGASANSRFLDFAKVAHWLEQR